MNLLPTYEQTIAEMKGDIEIPGMADSIWDRVAAVLDVEMPVNETPAAPKGKAFYKDPVVWVISTAIIAIIITLFILSKNMKTEPAPKRVVPQHTEPTIMPDTISRLDFKPPDILKPVPKKNERMKGLDLVVDTTRRSAIINVETDSLLKTPPDIVAPPVIKIPTEGVMDPAIFIKPRRRYGVEVSDSDYKFNVKPKE